MELVSCGSSSTTATPPPSTTAKVATPATTSGTATPSTGGGLPPYTPPPADAQGNPPCGLNAASWTTFFGQPGTPDGTSIEVFKISPVTSEQWTLPDYFTVIVQTTDLKHHTQEALVRDGGTGPWDMPSEFDFIFREIDPADVKEVLLTSRKGTCWVQGGP